MSSRSCMHAASIRLVHELEPDSPAEPDITPWPMFRHKFADLTAHDLGMVAGKSLMHLCKPANVHGHTGPWQARAEDTPRRHPKLVGKQLHDFPRGLAGGQISKGRISIVVWLMSRSSAALTLDLATTSCSCTELTACRGQDGCVQHAAPRYIVNRFDRLPSNKQPSKTSKLANG